MLQTGVVLFLQLSLTQYDVILCIYIGITYICQGLHLESGIHLPVSLSDTWLTVYVVPSTNGNTLGATMNKYSLALEVCKE